MVELVIFPGFVQTFPKQNEDLHRPEVFHPRSITANSKFFYETFPFRQYGWKYEDYDRDVAEEEMLYEVYPGLSN